jgi:hypothetical protein
VLSSDDLTLSGVDPANLEFSPGEMHAMGEAALARVVAHIANLPSQPVSGDVHAEAVCRAM